MLKLDLEAVVEDACDEVLQFEIQISLINSKFVQYLIIISYYQYIDFLSESFLRRDYSQKSYCTQLCLGRSSDAFIFHLQQWLHTLVLERFWSMLGSQIGPIEWTLVIRQVARQPLPRVIPEKMCIEVSHCYRQDQDTCLYILKHFTDGLTPYSCDTLVIGLTLQSALADWWCLHWIPEPVDSSVYSSP